MKRHLLNIISFFVVVMLSVACEAQQQTADIQDDKLQEVENGSPTAREYVASIPAEHRVSPVGSEDVGNGTLLLRYPDIHDQWVTFVYGGDIWVASSTGGHARRVTSHPGLELFPKFSPDGKWIAFTGQYDGDEQVYVIPAIGGTPRRLTSYPARGPLPARWGYDNQVMGWTPDGGDVLFRSHRDHFNLSDSRLYTVPVNGGLPIALPMTHAGAGAFSLDGKAIFYSPLSRDFRTWKRYEGGWAPELWIFDFEKNAARKVTDTVRSEREPMWTDEGLFFVSDRDGALNLYTLNEERDTATQLTSHGKDVRWASADKSGNIVYELNGALRVYNGASNEDRLITIFVGDDGKSKLPRTVDVSDQIENFSLSPNAERISFTARGDIFSIAVTPGVTRNLTYSSTAHDRNATWSPSGDRLAYISDQSGEEEIWIVDALGETSPRQLTSGNKTRFYRLEWAPDATKLAVGNMSGELFAVDVDSGGMSKIGDMGAWYNQDFSWSPDSQYIAFSALGKNFFRSIHIWNAQSNEARWVTDENFNAFSPDWHPNGHHLYYLSDREHAPQIGSIEWNYVVDRETQLYALALQKNAPNPFLPTSPEATDSDDDVAAKNNKIIVIDFSNIEQRVIRVPIDSDNYNAVVVGENNIMLLRSTPFYYGREADVVSSVFKYSIQNQNLSLLAGDTASGQRWIDGPANVLAFDYAQNAEKVLVRQRRGFFLYSATADGKEPVRISTEGLKTDVLPAEEWSTIFDESWRRFRDFFYVDNMHGFDWETIGESYRKLLPHVSHRSDLNYLLGEMVGELNVGHSYIFGGDQYLPDRPKAAFLGARFEFDASVNAYRFSKIFDGDNAETRYRSPLTEVGVDIAVGDYLLEINGRKLTKQVTPFSILRNAGDGLLELVVNDKPVRQGARRIAISPVSSDRNMIYLDWVQRNRKTVDALSAGRVGYIHIPNMGSDGLREFIKWYYGQIRKDGLVIDVRGNSGGNVSQMILERLMRTHYSMGYVKGERYPRTYPWGVGGAKIFTGELAVIANETTLSDGDAFTWTFKQTKRGPIIGRRTWGGVIGIDNTGPLLDGGGLRVPQFAFANNAGEWVVEGTGVAPDIDVENDPVSLIAGKDNQLERAVVEVMDAIGDNKPGELPAAAPAPVKTP